MVKRLTKFQENDFTSILQLKEQQQNQQEQIKNILLQLQQNNNYMNNKSYIQCYYTNNELNPTNTEPKSKESEEIDKTDQTANIETD